MVATCCVCGKERLPPGHSLRSFHRFPKSSDLREKWYAAIGRKISYKTAVVCSDHFTKEDFRSQCESRPLLKVDAIPVVRTRTPGKYLYIIYEHSYSAVRAERSITINNKAIEGNNIQGMEVHFSNEIVQPEPAHLGIFREEDFASDTAWKRFVKYMSITKSSMKNIIRKNTRLQNKVQYLEEVVNKLEKQNRLKVSFKKKK